MNLSNNSNVDVKGTEDDNRSTETEIMALHIILYLIFWYVSDPTPYIDKKQYPNPN